MAAVGHAHVRARLQNKALHVTTGAGEYVPFIVASTRMAPPAWATWCSIEDLDLRDAEVFPLRALPDVVGHEAHGPSSFVKPVDRELSLVHGDVHGALRAPVDKAAPAIPVSVAFYAEITADDGALVEASSVGLHAQPVLAEVFRGEAGRASYKAFVPSGAYRRVVDSAAPYAEHFPPIVGELGLTSDKEPAGAGLLSDVRPLSNAEVLAAPAAVRGADVPPWGRARAARTRTGAGGEFALELDEGEYDFTAMPEPGSGFPWRVSPRRPVGPVEATIDVVVPAPSRVSWDLKDPNGNAVPLRFE